MTCNPLRRCSAWKYGTGSNSASRSASHSRAAELWRNGPQISMPARRKKSVESFFAPRQGPFSLTLQTKLRPLRQFAVPALYVLCSSVGDDSGSYEPPSHSISGTRRERSLTRRKSATRAEEKYRGTLCSYLSYMRPDCSSQGSGPTERDSIRCKSGPADRGRWHQCRQPTEGDRSTKRRARRRIGLGFLSRTASY